MCISNVVVVVVVVVPSGRGPAYSGPICWGLYQQCYWPSIQEYFIHCFVPHSYNSVTHRPTSDLSLINSIDESTPTIWNWLSDSYKQDELVSILPRVSHLVVTAVRLPAYNHDDTGDFCRGLLLHNLLQQRKSVCNHAKMQLQQNAHSKHGFKWHRRWCYFTCWSVVIRRFCYSM